MAFSIIGALAALASAGAGIASAASSNNGAANEANGIARSQYQNTLNQQQYEKMLNALALQRSVAGATDGQGSSIHYDPATNTWVTTLGPQAAKVQNASTNAAISRNTTDLRTAQGANENAIMRSLLAERAAGPALAAVRNFTPINTDQLAGMLQQRATLANRQAEDPIIADTLRQFTRAGTAAGPVLTQLQRDNADTLRKTVMDDTINALTQGANINNQNRAGLVGTYQALNREAQPNLNFAPLSSNNPSDLLSQEIASRANNAGSVPTSGLFGTALGTNASNTAAAEAIRTVPNSNLGGVQLASVGSQLKDLANNPSIRSLINSLTTSSTNPPSGIPNDPNRPPSAAYFNGETQVPYYSPNSGAF